MARRVHNETVSHPEADPFAGEVTPIDGDMPKAVAEWQAAVIDLEGKFAAYTAAQERHVVALGRMRAITLKGG